MSDDLSEHDVADVHALLERLAKLLVFTRIASVDDRGHRAPAGALVGGVLGGDGGVAHVRLDDDRGAAACRVGDAAVDVGPRDDVDSLRRLIKKQESTASSGDE